MKAQSNLLQTCNFSNKGNKTSHQKNWFFRGPVLKPSRCFHRFMIFGFYYFGDDPPLDNDGDEKDEQDKYSVDKDDHDDEDSDKEQGDRVAPQKRSKKKPS